MIRLPISEPLGPTTGTVTLFKFKEPHNICVIRLKFEFVLLFWKRGAMSPNIISTAFLIAGQHTRDVRKIVQIIKALN